MSDIAKLRKALGLSQKDTADRAALTRSIISEVEAKHKGLSVAASLKAAPVLGVGAGSLYLGSQLAAIKSKVEEEEITEEAAADKLLRVLRTLLDRFEDVENEEGADELITALEELLEEYTGNAVASARGTKPEAKTATKSRGSYHPAFDVAFKAAGTAPVDPRGYGDDDREGRGFYGERLSAARLRDQEESDFADISAYDTANMPMDDEDDDLLEDRDAFGRSTRGMR